MRRSNDDFSSVLWAMAGGKPRQNRGRVPALTPLSTEMSAALKSRGLTFVGPTIGYAFMQAAGIVNDHAESCFRRKVGAKP